MKPALAQIYNPAIGEARPPTPVRLAEYIGTFLQAALILGGLAVLGMLVLGGFQYVTSQGDKMAVDKAKNIITYALIGLVILVAIIPVVKIIETVFGISILEVTWPGPGITEFTPPGFSPGF